MNPSLDTGSLDPAPRSDVRPVFATAARSLAAVVGTIRADQWDQPGLGVWDVRALTGHALRGVSTCEDYLATPATGEVTIADSGAYVAAALTTPGVHDAIAERGREGGRLLGDDPAAVVRATVERVVPLVEATPLDTKVALPFGTIVFGDYVPTRITEIVAHTEDLCRAIGHPSVATTDEVRVVLSLVADTAGAEAGLAIIRAVFGREGLPEGFNLWS